MARINNSRKALFQTPGSVNEEQAYIFTGVTSSTKIDIVEKALSKSAATLENEFSQTRKDAHKERLAKLKLLLNDIEDDNWKYENVEKLIGI